ncbi:hypothetical protein GCM10008013_11610 [Paenibacillus segetis]|uniref:Peptidase M15C domain-containing protein n=1 Tax=Paenibacillus segetis TaxID=1325360 RepID=A0ABQ1Y9P6_9BACL|nr:hypothetical protein GCM10008013_11610 [Paenibacillus segetis]
MDFEWGGDWSGSWDKPHLQYNYKGYGTDIKLDIPKGDEEMSPAEKEVFTALQNTF